MKKLAFITLLVSGVFAANAGAGDFTNHLAGKKYEAVYDSEKISPFHMAIVKGDFETVKKLVSMGAEVNERASNGMTPLMFAARYNRIDILRFLIEAGADLKAKNSKNGFTALKYAELSNANEAYSILENALGV
ncbi:MAG: ankyrin repeat domain-containing protein [Sinomicrobium sp.]|nr:ankyrin repeat domain-containing protein [Sinomicrobium sp.]